jgi:hypothetical protein
MNPSSAMALVSAGVMSAPRTVDVSAAPNARLRRANIVFVFMLVGSLHPPFEDKRGTEWIWVIAL